MPSLVFGRQLLRHRGEVSHYRYTKALETHLTIGENHPLRITDQVRSVLGSQSAELPWPKGHSSPRDGLVISKANRLDTMVRSVVTLVPKFVSEAGTKKVSYGYNEAHKTYNDMRMFFAKHAMSTHKNEVVVIKFVMSTFKPGQRNAHMISVCTTLV